MKVQIQDYLSDLLQTTDQKLTVLTSKPLNQSNNTKTIVMSIALRIEEISDNNFFVPYKVFSNVDDSNQYNMF